MESIANSAFSPMSAGPSKLLRPSGLVPQAPSRGSKAGMRAVDKFHLVHAVSERLSIVADSPLTPCVPGKLLNLLVKNLNGEFRHLASVVELRRAEGRHAQNSSQIR